MQPILLLSGRGQYILQVSDCLLVFHSLRPPTLLSNRQLLLLVCLRSQQAL